MKINSLRNTHKIVIISPKNCTESEIKGFYQIVQKSGEVLIDTAEDGIKNSQLLAYYYSHGELAGIAALKYTPIGYQNCVFDRAGVPDLADKYDLEIGYVFTKRKYRRQGICKNLIRELIDKSDSDKIFSTARTENRYMVKILECLNFKKVGKPFLGRMVHRGVYFVQLFVFQRSNFE